MSEDEELRAYDEPSMWICACGNIVESEFHCPNCGFEPPWGCDCGQHTEDDLSPEEERDLLIQEEIERDSGYSDHEAWE